MRTLVVLILLAVALASCTTEQGTSALDEAVAKASVDSLWQRYAKAIDQPDSADLRDLFTLNAVYDVSGQATAKGPSAIQASLDSTYRDFDATAFRVEPDEFKVSRALAVQSGTYEVDGTQKGAEVRQYGRYVFVLEKQGGGAWRAARLTAIADSTKPRL